MTISTRALGATLELFDGDRWNRLLAKLTGRRHPGVLTRSFLLVGITWGVTAALAWHAEPGFGEPGRTSFFYDVSAHAQLLAFFPLAAVAESYVGSKMRYARRRLGAVVPETQLDGATRQAERLSRSAVADVVCVALAFLFMSTWALDEVTNGIPSWHSELVPGGERFTAAGLWTVVVALPVFTYSWLRWAWKVCAWTWFLFRVSRLPLRLHPTHPDRTGGLGCLSDVQTSFAIMLFASGLLFAGFLYYKVAVEGTGLESYTVSGPLIGYVILAPSAFLAPLFLFTAPLYRAREEGLVLYTSLGTYAARRAERADADDIAHDEPDTAGLEEARAAFDAVSRMRVVPFDLRSVVELFSSALGPFLPLLDFFDLAERLQSLLS